MPMNRAPTTERSSSDTTRRKLLATGGVIFSGATAGCLDRFGVGFGGDDGENVERPSATPGPANSRNDSGEDGTYTTVERTETFAELTGERTPFPTVQPVQLGSGGRLLILFFDYDDTESIRWWQETYPEIAKLVESGTIRLQFGTHPLPASRWSMLLPSALLAVKRLHGNEAAVEFHRGLIEAAPDYSEALLRDLAERVGADPSRIVAAATERRRRDQVLSMRDFGRKQGVESLPAAYHPDGLLSDASAATIRQVYESDG